MLRRLWLTFAQATTIALAVLFVVNTLRPEWLARAPRLQPAIVPVQESAAAAAGQTGVSFAEGARRAMPAVVNIYTARDLPQTHPLMEDPVFRYFFGGEDAQTQRVPSLGSGVIVSPQGYIVTNYHVVEAAADGIEVALSDGRKARATLVGSDPDTDLAVLKLDLPNLPAITFGHSETAQVGDVVLAIGNPFGVGQTVTLGIVSAVGRSQLGLNTFENFIQTDAAINPGNSGGALVDANGNLVGINSAIYTRSGGSQGIGFAIPAATARDVMQQLIEKGSVTRGWLGIGLQALTPETVRALDLAVASGVLITEIVGGAPADKAGVKPGDVLVAVNERAITDQSVALNSIAALKPGDVAALKLYRGKREVVLRVTAAARPKQRS